MGLKRELRRGTAEETERRRRLGGILEGEATGYLEGLYNPEISGIRTGYAGERDRARNRVAITGNRAGYGATQLELGRQEGRAVSDSVRRGRLIGLDLMRGLHGESSGYLQRLFDQRLQRRAQGSTAMQWARPIAGGVGTAVGGWAAGRG